MHAIKISGVVPKISAGSAPVAAAGVGADVAAVDGVDFAALLKAQLAGVADLALTSAGDDPETLTIAGVTQEIKTDISVDPTQQNLLALYPMPVDVAPDVPVEQGNEPPVSMPVIKLAAEKQATERQVAELPDASVLGLDLPKDKTPLNLQAKAAEFAVDGKVLPPGLADKDVEKVKGISFDVARSPESAPLTLPVTQSANQTAPVVEIKNALAAVQIPVGKSGWDEALGQKVVWMAGQQQQVAELRLNPPHLGPMEVRLTISNDQVSALFVSHQPAVREAIEAAMPRLREMFADNGMMLGNTMVSSDSLPQQHDPSGREGPSGFASRTGFSSADNVSAPSASGVLTLGGIGRGVVDLFA